jgi:16S rRNA (adenine1518-N6/adenine1519-N6)-dimethyltransferase
LQGVRVQTMNPPPIPLARLKAALEAAGAPPRRRHGQNFMIDPNLLASVARDGGAGPGDLVLEVGPGPGLLTRHLLASGARVLAIEIDPRMRRVAEQLIEPESWSRLTWVEADALAGTRALSAPLLQALPGCTRLIANLPYGVASPLLANLLCHPSPLARLVVTVQREAADRLLARPDGREYGPISVLVALCSRGRLLRPIPPAAFWPRPRVASALIELDLREDRPQAVAIEALAAFLPLAFHNRRKTLVNSVSEGSGIPAGRVSERLILEENFHKWRAEALDPVQLCGLALLWAASASSGRNRS